MGTLGWFQVLLWRAILAGGVEECSSVCLERSEETAGKFLGLEIEGWRTDCWLVQRSILAVSEDVFQGKQTCQATLRLVLVAVTKLRGMAEEVAAWWLLRSRFTADGRASVELEIIEDNHHLMPSSSRQKL